MPTSALRAVMAMAALANLVAGMLFGFPGSAAGSLAGLPPSVPVLYRELLALFILLFAGVYAGLARAARPSRELVWLGATGKLLAAASVILLWLLSECSGRCALLLCGDLVFAALFLAWLLGPHAAAPPPRLK